MVNHDQKKYENNLFPTKRKKEKLLFSWVGILFYKFLTLKCLKSKQKKEGLLFVNSTRYKKNVECNPGHCELEAVGPITHPVAKEKEINTDGQMSFFRTES